MSNPTEPHDDTLATEVFDHDQPLEDPPGTAAAGAPAGSTPWAPQERPYLRGPAPFAIVLGILGLLVAGSVVLGELTDLTMRWDNLGPWTVVAAGVVVLVIGALGVRASRPRD